MFLFRMSQHIFLFICISIFYYMHIAQIYPLLNPNMYDNSKPCEHIVYRKSPLVEPQ